MPSIAVSVAAGAGLVGSGISAYASQSAADTQASAARNAAQAQLSMFNTINTQLAPYRAAGTGAIGMVEGLLGLPQTGSGPGPGGSSIDLAASGKNLMAAINQAGYGNTALGQNVQGLINNGASWDQISGLVNTWGQHTTSPTNASAKALITGALTPQYAAAPAAAGGGAAGGGADMLGFLQQTPGYQFALQQGLQATQSGFAAQGLAESGPALKGAAQYAEGLASTTYEQQLQNYMNLMGTGLNAAGMAGQFGTQATSLANQYLTSGAAAQAAGTVGVANALSGGIGGAANLGLLYAMNPGGLFSGSSGGDSGINPVSVTPSVYGGY